MKTKIVSPSEWRGFFRDFSRIHDGDIISMHLSGPGLVAQDDVVNQPLRGISEDGDEVFVHVGNGFEKPHLARRVEHVDRIEVQQTDEGADAAVNIASLDGSRMTLRFRSPTLPELLDRAVE